jgi:hypothetical protein
MYGKAKSFMVALLDGKARIDEMDDYVQRWHDGAHKDGQTLREFLGMTADEYQLCLHSASVLTGVLAARRAHTVSR